MKLPIVLTMLVALALPAVAGDCGSCKGSDCDCSLCGFECENACPLAKQANDRRALGTEAAASSKALQRDAAAAVEKNLAKI